ncbi:hypothetical protein LSH36_824g03055 [Paralvinella palmiformis]|uniref:Little elongation complex subunit 1 C-terminal domain-containing protein n=1 Tax=Paralvinella palmiformis TaxID=53620 RepID=A0AAD9MSD3_9ANNE|nr:hypothetical protein LSH36_824g03055 [Paralvinella palmiformis]
MSERGFNSGVMYDELTTKKKELQEYKEDLDRQKDERNILQKKIQQYEVVINKYELQQTAIRDSCHSPAISSTGRDNCQSPVTLDSIMSDPGAHISGLCFPWGVAARPCVLGHRDLRHRAESGVIGAEAKKSKSANNLYSPLAAVTVEEIFQEMGVYDDDDDDVVDDVVMITNLSPALSPIPPSPAPVKDVKSTDVSSETSHGSVTSDDSDIESVADLLEDKLMSSEGEGAGCHGNNKPQLLQRQLSVDYIIEDGDGGDDDDDDDDDDIEHIPFSHLDSLEDDHVTQDGGHMTEVKSDATDACVEKLDDGNRGISESNLVTEEGSRVTNPDNYGVAESTPGTDECNHVTKAKDYGIEESSQLTEAHSPVHEENHNSMHKEHQPNETLSPYLPPRDGSTVHLAWPVVKPARRSRSASANQPSEILRRSSRIKRLSEGDRSIGNTQDFSELRKLKCANLIRPSDIQDPVDDDRNRLKPCDNPVNMNSHGAGNDSFIEAERLLKEDLISSSSCCDNSSKSDDKPISSRLGKSVDDGNSESEVNSSQNERSRKNCTDLVEQDLKEEVPKERVSMGQGLKGQSSKEECLNEQGLIEQDVKGSSLIEQDVKGSSLIEQGSNKNDQIEEGLNERGLIEEELVGEVQIGTDSRSPPSVVVITDDALESSILELVKDNEPHPSSDGCIDPDDDRDVKAMETSSFSQKQDPVQKDPHPALPKQSSTGFEVLASEDIFSDSSGICSPNTDVSPLCHNSIKEHKPWTFPVLNKARSLKPHSPVRFTIGESLLIPCQTMTLEDIKEGDTHTSDGITISQLANMKDDDIESVSSVSFSLIDDFPSPISPLSDFGSSGEFVIDVERNVTKSDSELTELSEKNNNVSLSAFNDIRKLVPAPSVCTSSDTTRRKPSTTVDIESDEQPKAVDGTSSRVVPVPGAMSDGRPKARTCVFKRKLPKSVPLFTSRSRRPLSPSGTAHPINDADKPITDRSDPIHRAPDPVTGATDINIDASDSINDAVIPKKRQKKEKVSGKTSNPDKVEKITITKQQKKIIERELQNLLTCVAMTTQQAVDRLRSSGVSLKGVAEVIINYIISSSRDMLAGWHTNCLSCDVPPTPWLSEAERRYIDLIKCLDLLETGVMTYFMTRVKTMLLSNTLHVPAPVVPALCRLYVALCRSLDQLERCRVFTYDFVYLKINLYSAMITAVAGVWPQVLYRDQTGTSPILHVLEYIILVKTLHSDKPRHNMMSSILCKLCNWEKPSSDRDALTNQLVMQLLSVAMNEQREVFECERALDLLARHEDWAWTNDVLVRKHLWPILQQWGSEKGDDSQGDLVQSVLRLVGFLMSHCPADKADITRHMMTTFVTLLQQSEQVSRQIQSISIQSLIRLSPYDPDCTTSCLQYWISDKKRLETISEDDQLLIENCLKHYKH